MREKAHPTLRDAMDLALLTGQRPADVLKIKRADIHDGALWIVQNKTGAKRAIDGRQHARHALAVQRQG